MDAEQKSASNRCAAKFGAFAATLAVAVAVVPSSAGATVVTPHAVKPQAVTAHVNTPATTSSPAQSAPPAVNMGPSPAPSTSAPSSPAPTPSPQPAPNSGTNSGPGDSDPQADPPFPEGLPSHEDPSCDMDCKQEWYDYYDSRQIKASVEAQAGGTEDEKRNAALLSDEVKNIEDEIKAEGGTPGEPNDSGSSTDVGSPSVDSPSQGDPQGMGDGTPPEIEPDAISGASAIVGDSDLFDGFVGSLVTDLVNGIAGNDVVQFTNGQFVPAAPTPVAGTDAGPLGGVADLFGIGQQIICSTPTDRKVDDTRAIGKCK